MKNLIILINIIIIIGMASIFTQPESLKTEETKSDEPSGDLKHSVRSDFAVQSRHSETGSSVDEFVTDFLIEMAEARLMDLEEGKIAQQRSTTKELKAYGTLMVKEQSEMLEALKKIAADKGILLPAQLGPDKADGLSDLREVHGKSFDKKFIKMMIIDHKRDAKKFELATRSNDADIQVFATRYLPYVQSHLERIKSLK